MLNMFFKLYSPSLMKTIDLVQLAYFATGETGVKVKNSRCSKGSSKMETEPGSPELSMSGSALSCPSDFTPCQGGLGECSSV